MGRFRRPQTGRRRKRQRRRKGSSFEKSDSIAAAGALVMCVVVRVQATSTDGDPLRPYRWQIGGQLAVKRLPASRESPPAPRPANRIIAVPKLGRKGAGQRVAGRQRATSKRGRLNCEVSRHYKEGGGEEDGEAEEALVLSVP